MSWWYPATVTSAKPDMMPSLQSRVKLARRFNLEGNILGDMYVCMSMVGEVVRQAMCVVTEG
jgi:hypothetical protein